LCKLATRAIHGEVDVLDIGEQRGRRFVLLRIKLTSRRRGHATFVQVGAETSDTGMEALKSRTNGVHSRTVGAHVGDETTEFRSVVKLFRYCCSALAPRLHFIYKCMRIRFALC